MATSDQVADLFGIARGSALLEEALTHPSYANEVRDARHYQRLEFLGDSVLGLCAAELLYEKFPEADEGLLTRLRAQIVNGDSLAAWARSVGLGEALRLGKGADSGGLRDSTNALCDMVEAIVAVAFVDGGMEGARGACRLVLGTAVDALEVDSGRDPKSELQERVQRRGFLAPSYEVVGSGGSAHDPWFAVSVSVAGRVLAEGKGRSKRLAERQAATTALATLGDDGAPTTGASGSDR